MNENQFEWDAEKAVTNWRNHGVTFVQAAGAFSDPFAIEHFDEQDDYYRENAP